MSAPTTEAYTPQQEQKSGSERLSPDMMKKELARLAVLALLISVYSSRESDKLFEQLQTEEKKAEDEEVEEVATETNSGELLGLIDCAAQYNRGELLDEDDPAFRSIRASAYAARLRSADFHGTPNPGSVSDFTPAPTMSAVPVGPQLPNLAAQDYIHAQGAQPSAEQVTAADRANEMYQRELVKQGWMGGEATPDQAKKAGRAMQRQYHPDVGAAKADQDALKAFNSQHAKPTTPGQKDAPAR
jgi:hypothetical protein